MYKKELILIADDNDEVLNYTFLVIQMMGYEAVKCKNGEEAYQQTILLNPGLIMITGTDQSSELLATALEEGVNDFLRKPFVRSELHARIKSLLKQALYMKQIIEIKNNELNNSAMQLAQAIELKNLILSHLEVINSKAASRDLKVSVSELINVIKISDKTNPLDKLHTQFTDINKDFVSNLLLRHPKLTPAEIKLSMLLRLNLDTKEIAALSFQTYDSVRVSRTRLREKLSLAPEDKLNVYLMQF